MSNYNTAVGMVYSYHNKAKEGTENLDITENPLWEKLSGGYGSLNMYDENEVLSFMLSRFRAIDERLSPKIGGESYFQNIESRLTIRQLERVVRVYEGLVLISQTLEKHFNTEKPDGIIHVTSHWLDGSGKFSYHQKGREPMEDYRPGDYVHTFTTFKMNTKTRAAVAIIAVDGNIEEFLRITYN